LHFIPLIKALLSEIQYDRKARLMDLALQKMGYFITGVRMKRFLFPLLLFFGVGIFFPVASFAEGSRSITILYTGSVKGTVDPCPS